MGTLQGGCGARPTGWAQVSARSRSSNPERTEVLGTTPLSTTTESAGGNAASAGSRSSPRGTGEGYRTVRATTNKHGRWYAPEKSTSTNNVIVVVKDMDHVAENGRPLP